MWLIVKCQRYENEGIMEITKKVAKCEDVASVFREYKTLIKTNEKNIIDI